MKALFQSTPAPAQSGTMESPMPRIPTIHPSPTEGSIQLANAEEKYHTVPYGRNWLQETVGRHLEHWNLATPIWQPLTVQDVHDGASI